jgi:HTH-like domain
VSRREVHPHRQAPRGLAGGMVVRGARSGFYAWLTRPPRARTRSDEDLSAKVRASFLASDRTYGARRVWRDVLADGVSCGLHRIERLMRRPTVVAAKILASGSRAYIVLARSCSARLHSQYG